MSSQTRTDTGQGAVFLTLFALFWDVIVFKWLLPLGNTPFWFKAVFVIGGIAITWAALRAWWQRLKGGRVNLTLSSDPVPHGVPVSVVFQTDRTISADEWLIEAKIESSARRQSGFGLVWTQDYPARVVDSHCVMAELTLPSDCPSSAASDDDMTYKVTLTLKAKSLRWAFQLNTRAATASEAQFGSRDSVSLGNKIPSYTPEQMTTLRRRSKAWMYGLVILGLLLQLSFFFDFALWPRAKALVGAEAYSSDVKTDEFEVRVTNQLINDWALRGRLVGKGRVVNGTLIVRLESLTVQPVGACTADSRVCEVESVSLLLTRDSEKSFSTLASSSSIPVNANLRDITRWSLPPERASTEISMQLPPVIETDGIRFKLQIRSAGGSTVYPDHGPRLNLQRALAKAQNASDPCEHLSGKLELLRAGCIERLQVAVQNQNTEEGTLGKTWAWVRKVAHELAARLGLGTGAPPVRDTPDELLLEALQTENFAAVPVLLAAGASPDAHSPEDKGRTALGYAAAANEGAMVERLLTAGANVNARKANEQGQIVTPVTQALRTDAAAAIHRLLQAGAATSTQDPSGWTPMHIAAYESAHLSIAELVASGADVNERTPAYRQQTVLQTALQFGSIETVRTLLRLGADRQAKDNQGKDACDWVQFFKRNVDMQALVCP